VTTATVCAILLFVLSVEADAGITIISQPPTKAKVGQVYEYQVRVLSSFQTDVIRYRLKSFPQGMSIDSLSGLIRWTPQSVGYYLTEIHAFNQRGERAYQRYHIKVSSFLGVITGTVKNDSGQAVRKIFVTLYPKTPPVHILLYPPRPYPYTHYEAITDSLGRYTIADADSGEYFAFASVRCNMCMGPYCPNQEYADVWYEDSPTIIGATPIPVRDSVPVTINFTMHRRILPKLVSISGLVADTLGIPIKGAVVAASPYLRSPVVLTSGVIEPNAVPRGFCDPAFGFLPDAVAHTRTDASGKFTLSVMSDGPYIVACMASGYLLQFYQEKGNPLDADRLTLTRDTTGVDFKLLPVPVATARILGSVRDSAGANVVSKIVLYKIGAGFHRTRGLHPVLTDSLGRFVVEGVSSGSYLLQAIPFRDYMPAFYKAGDCSVIRWQHADTIVVRDLDVSGIVVCVNRAYVRGAGTITGRVTSTDGSALSGVVVTAKRRMNSSLATYAVTDVNGRYELTDLDQGQYDLSADKMSYSSLQTQLGSVDYQHTGAAVNFELVPQRVTSIRTTTPEVPGELWLSQNYPNPFNPATKIQFALPIGGRVTLKLFNVLGREVLTLFEGSKDAGYYEVELDARSLASGMYFCTLEFANKAIVRKMVLVK